MAADGLLEMAERDFCESAAALKSSEHWRLLGFFALLGAPLVLLSERTLADLILLALLCAGFLFSQLQHWAARRTAVKLAGRLMCAGYCAIEGGLFGSPYRIVRLEDVRPGDKIWQP